LLIVPINNLGSPGIILQTTSCQLTAENQQWTIFPREVIPEYAVENAVYYRWI